VRLSGSRQSTSQLVRAQKREDLDREGGANRVVGKTRQVLVYSTVGCVVCRT
jgi:hypothetical protein